MKTIFEAAAALPRAEQAAYLDTACVRQPELRARVEALLHSFIAEQDIGEPAMRFPLRASRKINAPLFLIRMILSGRKSRL